MRLFSLCVCVCITNILVNHNATADCCYIFRVAVSVTNVVEIVTPREVVIISAQPILWPWCGLQNGRLSMKSAFFHEIQ